ncbi:hypothetical protein K432DRAFT_402362 [Lepidopterella palustris CBS 459.81]|uniref:VOC domain-containing protein n=1 Tax=Lepidopterella palustris CBS 459.81 TaxID=1314670 RepID=A0A8E2JHN8_9PEZI|nr:hypothetical protein K432DRAFT_402362 [Lepidopterella palustris CBS 459.81]
MAYKINHMWHPSYKVTDLVATEKFFKDVFGRDSFPVEQYLPPKELAPNYPRDYAILTMIQEVLFDSIDPKKYVVEGRPTYEEVDTPHLFCLGFAAEGVEEIYKVCIANGIRSTDQANRLGSSKQPPITGFSKAPIFFTLPESTGLRYQIFPLSATGPPDPRADPGWKLPPVSDSDPLSLEFCSHHTILTSDPVKGLNFLVGILKGRIIHQGRNQLLETNSFYISLGDGVYELAVPTRAGSFAAEDIKFNAPFDTYHSVTWKVRDLSRVEEHLASKNIRTLLRNDNTIVTNPEDTIGIPWGFTDKLVPGDYRLPG